MQNKQPALQVNSISSAETNFIRFMIILDSWSSSLKLLEVLLTDYIHSGLTVSCCNFKCKQNIFCLTELQVIIYPLYSPKLGSVTNRLSPSPVLKAVCNTLSVFLIFDVFGLESLHQAPPPFPQLLHVTDAVKTWLLCWGRPLNLDP